MQAIILAGGFGTRLRSVVGEVPKPVASVRGRPFLSWLLEYMAWQGVTEAVLCVHHRADAIRSYFASQYAGIRLRYSVEDNPLGTGGAICQAMRMLDPKNPVFVLNGDSLVQLNYRVMLAHHYRQRAPITLAADIVPDCSRYSQLVLSGHKVVRYDTLGMAAPGHISVGFYVVSPDVFNGVELPEAFSFERDFLHPHTPRLAPAVYTGVHYFIDIGVPADYIRAQEEIPERMDIVLAA
jgi:D-glycero-alpha-D-manno-heptose 1-phosphate guanylyltransferase